MFYSYFMHLFIGVYNDRFFGDIFQRIYRHEFYFFLLFFFRIFILIVFDVNFFYEYDISIFSIMNLKSYKSTFQ